MSKIIFVLLFLPLSLLAQVNRYFVSFKDKTNSPYSLSTPLDFLTQKSIDRRIKENFIIDGNPVNDEDIPVDSAYVNQVRKTGASTFYTSRWFNGVLIQADASLVPTISALLCVSNVEFVAPGSKLNARIAAHNKFEQTTTAASVADQAQLQMVGLDQMHALGYHGEGIDVAVFDGGFINASTMIGFQSLFQESRIKSVFNFVENSTNVYQAHDHGTGTLSILAGNIPGTFFGGAYKANYYLFITEDVSSEYRIEEYNWLFAAERADSLGVDVISSSLGYNEFDSASMNYTYSNMDGNTTVISRAAHKAALRGISVVSAAGNEGSNAWHYITAPADAAGVITVGATYSNGTVAPFSSVGPSYDQRIKPDVAALGVGSSLFTSSGCCFSGNGTSFACPLVAGLVADLHQIFPKESAGDIYNRLINMSTLKSSPNNMLGYGIPVFRFTNIANEKTPEFNFYPNPVRNNKLNIEIKGIQECDTKFTITDVLGQRVLDLKESLTASPNNIVTIDLSSLHEGVYLVNAVTPIFHTVMRVVKVD